MLLQYFQGSCIPTKSPATRSVVLVSVCFSVMVNMVRCIGTCYSSGWIERLETLHDTDLYNCMMFFNVRFQFTKQYYRFTCLIEREEENHL